MADSGGRGAADTVMPSIIFKMNPSAASSIPDFASRLFSSGRITEQQYYALIGAHDSDAAISPRDTAQSLYSSGQIKKMEYKAFLTLDKAEHSSPNNNPQIHHRNSASSGRKNRTMEAASKVFDTNELLELILQQLDTSDSGIWKRAKLTCKAFKTAIESSPSLRERTNFTFYRNAPPPPKLMSEPSRDQPLNEALMAKWNRYLGRLEKYKDLKINKRFQRIEVLEATESWGPENEFYFSFYPYGPRDGDVFERYRKDPNFRNVRVFEESSQTMSLKFRIFHQSGNSSRYGTLSGLNITFGQLLDKVAKVSIRGPQDHVRQIMFALRKLR